MDPFSQLGVKKKELTKIPLAHLIHAWRNRWGKPESHSDVHLVMDSLGTKCPQNFAIKISQVVLYTLNLYSVVYKLHLYKIWKRKEFQPLSHQGLKAAHSPTLSQTLPLLIIHLANICGVPILCKIALPVE